MSSERVRWPGSSSFSTGSTPFGYFDLDPTFQVDIDGATKWAATRLGFPIVDIEMIDINFYSCFEEAVLEYGAQVNQFNIRQNIGLLAGLSTETNVTQANINGSALPFIINMSQAYGTEVGIGGNVDWKRGYIQVNALTQSYDLQKLWADQFESGSRIEIRRIFHHSPPASARIYDPYSMTGMSYSNILNEMGFAGYSPATQFLMCPIFEDLLRIQGIEFNDLVRKSAYSFELVNNKLRIFPIPTYTHLVYFDYMIVSDRNAQVSFPSGSLSLYTNSSSVASSVSPVIGDYSNVPYKIIPYTSINEVGKQWIRKYFLALCKELLGAIRQKYQTIPIPGSEVTLDGAELRSEAQQEKEQLLTFLRENLEASSRKTQMENRAMEAEQIESSLKRVPLFIYVG